MFIPSHFHISEQEEIDRFIAQNSFGILVSQHEGELLATHLPVHRIDEDRMQAHIARANPQWQQIDGQRVLIILPGPHDYVSPKWYESEGVPTWNYQTVHLYGHATCFTDPDKLRELVMTLSNTYEASREEPWQGEFDERMLKAIVGIEFRIESIECKFKLSQNRSRADQERVSKELERAGNTQLAEAMRKHKQLD